MQSRARHPVASLSPAAYLSNRFKGKSTIMTSFDDRERSFEAKFARDEEMAFRIVARRNKLVAQWAAELMKLTPAETDSYAKEVVRAEFEEAGDEDVLRKLMGDLTAAGVDVAEADVRRALDQCLVEARRQLMEAQ